jgi:nickel-dependent lactate racemase
MPELNLKYGRGSIPFVYDEDRFDVLDAGSAAPPLSDAEIGAKLDSPVGSRRIEDIVHPGETVLFVVPDATRRTACGEIINLLVRRLIAGGTAPHEMKVLFATGIHRPVTDDEKHAILTPFIAQRIKTLDHNPRDLMQIVRLGRTSGGITVELNRALTEHDHVILLGGVSFHYFAGFTGGRKLICPGLASARTIADTHKLAFDCDSKTRRGGVGTGLLDGNAVHEAFVEAASFIKPSFAVNTIVDDAGKAIDLVCGDWIESHTVACEMFAKNNTVVVPEKRGLVIASCGGSPHDINMIQAHKALEAASNACSDGGMIVLLAECPEGAGHSDFLKWFEAENTGALADRLCEKYQVNGQTAWSLLAKTERFDIRIVTSLPADDTRNMRMKKVGGLQELAEANGAKGYILKYGARNLIRTAG